MATLGDRAALSDAERSDLQDRLNHFHSAWSGDGTTAPETFLPPPGSRHRPHTLVELLKADMERRARAGLPVRVEGYLTRLPADTRADPLPLTLIAEEYRVRTRHGDRPEFAEYKARFPKLADALRAVIGTLPEPDALAPPPPADPGPAAKTVESSLGMIRTTPADGTRPVPRPPSVDDDDILPADVGYRLTRRLGVGSYGEVFEAIAPGGFRVAVKRILRAADHPSSQGEAASLEVMKAMSHPFLLQMHAYWTFRDRLVIVMELAEGSLAGEVQRHKAAGRMGVPPEELVPFFEQAAEALDYLHSQRVTHRDVKPENLLLLKGYAKVADFGLARGHRHDETTVVAEVGTPLYMAPEVWKRAVNIHSDQYSLAATYVAARLGRPLFPATTLFDLCYQHVHDTPDLAPLDAAERAVLLKALAKRPDERYRSCAAFARALGEAVFPPPPPPAVKRRTALWFGLVIGFGAAGGLVAKLSRDETPPPPPPVPPVPPPPPPWTPVNWSGVADAGIETVPDGRRLYKRLTRTIGDEKLVAILIPPARDRDPAPFYMLQNKVTSNVFKQLWDAADRDPNSRLNFFRGTLPREAGVEKVYLPENWKFEPGDPNRPRVLYDSTPVLGVNAVQAILMAELLGGLVPTYDQWLKAVGAKGDGAAPGPAGPVERAGEDLTRRPLALGIPIEEGPWHVELVTADRSRYEIHQLVSNGCEWTAGLTESDRVNLDDRPGAGLRLRQTGQSYMDRQVLTFTRIPDNVQMEDWLRADNLVGFRIVITPR